MEPARTNYLYGDVDYRTLAANYRCGHCNSDPATIGTDPLTGLPNVQVAHDDGCPVVTGAISALPDTLRAVGIPDTFRP